MGSNLNLKYFVSEPPGDGNGRPPGNFPLTRQPSIYSLTFDELQNTMGGSLGKDFGSMNMDELLKNIWSAEETQIIPKPSWATGPEGTGPPGGYLQRQGSLTLPRTLSQKTVDEVWRDISNDFTGNGTSSLPQTQRQQTLGEITLEEFLFRAGVVREDTQLDAKPGTGTVSTVGFLDNTGLGIGFQQTAGGTGLMGNRISESNNQFSIQTSNLPLNVNGVRSDQTQLSRPQQPQIFPKPITVGYGTHQMPQMSGPGMRGAIVAIGDQGLSSAALQGGGMGMVALGGGAGGVGVGMGSPANQLSSDGIGKSNGDMSSVSPVPYGFNGGLRGRRSGGPVEKVVERRQRRMIKNRESAARSRARKQAYTMELEAEVAKLKEENLELQKKQEEIMEMQKNQVMEIMNLQRGVKKQCLRKTQSGPW